MDIDHHPSFLRLMENVRVRRAGYAFRQVYPQFLFRYKMLAAETWPHWNGDPKTGVQKILQAQNIPKEEFAFGKSKIFIRNPRLVHFVSDKEISLLLFLSLYVFLNYSYLIVAVRKQKRVSVYRLLNCYRCTLKIITVHEKRIYLYNGKVKAKSPFP